jgi:hypothetical protein
LRTKNALRYRVESSALKINRCVVEGYGEIGLIQRKGIFHHSKLSTTAEPGEYDVEMSGAGPSGGMDQAFEAQAYRDRIAKMTDEQLIEEGKYYRQVVGYNLKPYDPRFQSMLNECIAEWRRRHPNLITAGPWTKPMTSSS